MLSSAYKTLHDETIETDELLKLFTVFPFMFRYTGLTIINATWTEIDFSLRKRGKKFSQTKESRRIITIIKGAEQNAEFSESSNPQFRPCPVYRRTQFKR